MDAIESAAAAWMRFVLILSSRGAVLVLLVLAAQWIFRKRLSPRWRYGLWLLVLVRLALPVTPESPTSIFNLARPGWNSKSTRLAPPPTLDFPEIQPRLTSFATEPNATPQTELTAHAPAPAHTPVARLEAPLPDRKLNLLSVAFFCWLAGVLALGLRVGVDALRVGSRVREIRPVTNSRILDVLEDCKQLMDVSTPFAVIESAGVQSPTLYGFVRPRLLLPKGLIETFTEKELRLVFLHELAHVKRGDIVVNWLTTALQIVHWFNPLIWLAFRQMRSDRELACDDLALRYAEANENRAYAQTILKLLEGFSKARALPGLVGILESKTQLADRLSRIADFAAPRGSVALGLAVALPLCLLTLTEAQEKGRHPETAETLTQKELLPQGGAWQRRASRPAPFAPSARIGHATIWTGRELIIWGGASESVAFNDGARYDFATDTWRPMSLHNAPSPRWFHAAVWTGTEMIVWGGRAQFASLQLRGDGARYNPRTDTWMPLAQMQAPTPRSQMGAVWTGTEMVIWGGAGEEWVIEPVGARYHPQTDTWQPIAETGAPEPRMEPSAVWTGSEMLVWGGVRYSPDQIVFNTGGRYDPARDLWIPLPTDGAPAARTGHTAIWTGQEMIIWGGHEDIHYMNSGARFSPAENIWVPTTLLGAPQRRMSHCAVWTGAEMIVWGGLTSPFDVTGAGARYDPQADEWRRVTNVGAPAPRLFQRDDSGVWTGNGMLVFGGGTGRREFDSLFLWNMASATGSPTDNPVHGRGLSRQ